MINWGILGAGNIAKRFVKGLAFDERACLYAVSCRSLEKAESFRAYADFEKAYDNYDALLDDPKVDIVYIALPHKHHCEYAIKALRKHKAVLCEKPAALNEEEVRKIVAVAKEENTFFMEAMKSKFVPMYQHILSLVQQGVVGKVEYAYGAFSYDITGKPERYLLDKDQGGCILDTGCYCLNFIQDVLGKEGTIDSLEYRLIDGVESFVDCKLNINGAIGEIVCGIDQNLPRNGLIKGTKGTIEIKDFHRPVAIKVSVEGNTYEEVIPYDKDDFYSEIKEVNDAYLAGKTQSDVMSFEDSIALSKLMDTIKSQTK